MLESTPRWAGRSTVPAASTTSPARTSSPARRTASPAATVLAIRTRSPVDSVSSTMTTASAPSGSGAPVMMRSAWPASTARSAAKPAARTPMASSSTGAPSVSAARTA